MGCCGDKRAALRHPQRPSSPGAAPLVEYVRQSSTRVRGPATGRVYTFTPAQRVQEVDVADLPYLLRSRLFRPAR